MSHRTFYQWTNMIVFPLWDDRKYYIIYEAHKCHLLLMIQRRNVSIIHLMNWQNPPCKHCMKAILWDLCTIDSTWVLSELSYTHHQGPWIMPYTKKKWLIFKITDEMIMLLKYFAEGCFTTKAKILDNTILWFS